MRKTRFAKVPVRNLNDKSKVETFISLNEVLSCIRIMFWNNEIEGFYSENNTIYAIFANGSRFVVGWKDNAKVQQLHVA